MISEVEINRWTIRVRCEMLVGLNIACSGLDCWFILPRGTLPGDVTAKPGLLWGVELRPWLLLGGGERGKASMKSTHTIPKWLETSYYYELKLLSLTVMFKLWKSQWCMASSMQFFEVHTNDVEQTCFEIPSCWEMEGLCENLWAHSLAPVCSMHFIQFWE